MVWYILNIYNIATEKKIFGEIFFKNEICGQHIHFEKSQHKSIQQHCQKNSSVMFYQQK